MLITQHLSVHAYQKTLLDNINICLKPATLYGLIGHNGSGKSTLIKVLSKEMAPSQGMVSLEDKPLTKFGAKEFAKKLAYLPQKLPDQSGFLVKELVMLGRYPHQGMLQKPSKQDEEVVLDAMQRTGVASFAQAQLSTLSGGERARAWLSMCLAQKTPYLLLDEPLAALDIVYQVQILKLIQKLAHDMGLCVLIIIHDINLAARFCDDIIALKGGKVCYQGSAQSMMQSDLLEDIFGIKLSLLTHPDTKQKVAVV